MPANKNALIRYKTIDRCLRNRFRRWTIDDLTEACSDALYEMEGIMKGVSVRTVQGDLQIMRSDKLGYEAPIEVYDKIYVYTTVTLIQTTLSATRLSPRKTAICLRKQWSCLVVKAGAMRCVTFSSV